MCPKFHYPLYGESKTPFRWNSKEAKEKKIDSVEGLDNANEENLDISDRKQSLDIVTHKTSSKSSKDEGIQDIFKS